MPDNKGSMEDILILVIRFAEDQVSVDNVEEFLKGKELQSELNKAFSQIAANAVKYGTSADAQQKIEADVTSKLPAAVGGAYGDHAKAIWKNKYEKKVKENVAEIKGHRPLAQGDARPRHLHPQGRGLRRGQPRGGGGGL